jgi:citrate/tricarballylate utilization protein
MDFLRAVRDALLLRNLGGGGGGCYYPEPEQPAGGRRLYHMLTVYGMTSAFAATVVAAAQQHLLGLLPPYPFLSAPVILGSLGGIGVIVGGIGLAVLRYRAARASNGATPVSEYTFIAALEIVAVTGMLLLALRSSAAMPLLLIVHLGAVAGLYLSLPFSKFVHAPHRLGALILDAAEVRAERDKSRDTVDPVDLEVVQVAATPNAGGGLA